MDAHRKLLNIILERWWYSLFLNKLINIFLHIKYYSGMIMITEILTENKYFKYVRAYNYFVDVTLM